MIPKLFSRLQMANNYLSDSDWDQRLNLTLIHRVWNSDVSSGAFYELLNLINAGVHIFDIFVQCETVTNILTHF